MPKRTVDLTAIREARDRLREIAQKHPELIGPSGPENTAGWEAVLTEEERMAETRMVSFRLPIELVDRIDAQATQRSIAAGIPGGIGRVDIVKLLLEAALDNVESAARRSPRGKTSSSKKTKKP